jgi:hypothetical protein
MKNNNQKFKELKEGKYIKLICSFIAKIIQKHNKKPPKLIIRKSDLLKPPCRAYNDLPEEFDAIKEIRRRGNDLSHLRWLITYCSKAQTQDMLDYYKSLNPNYYDVGDLIRYCKFAQTNEMQECLNSLK